MLCLVYMGLIHLILSRVGVTIDGVLDWMFGFIGTLHSTRDYSNYSATADLCSLQVTVTHALGFAIFTSRILATDV
jgi:hypothetical protein